MLRISVLILFLSRPFLEENLRDIPIFFSFFPARSFGIELEYNGGVLKKYQRFVCVFLVLLISRREEKQRKQKIYKAKYGTKKTSCSTRKCHTRSRFLDLYGRSQDAQMCLFRSVRAYLRFPMTYTDLVRVL